MKQKYDERDSEMRQLKFENAEIRNGFKKCEQMFKNADKCQVLRLKEQNAFLTRENERLQEKVKWTEEKLVELAKTHEIHWLDSMMEFIK